jgi:signal transduction histidine kinase
VALEVSDNGTGMSPDVQERIFDPFFSTKVAGRGLGLAAIRTIVRDHHGGIRVDSSPGRGSRFSLRFPGAGAPP